MHLIPKVGIIVLLVLGVLADAIIVNEVILHGLIYSLLLVPTPLLFFAAYLLYRIEKDFEFLENHDK